MNKTGNTMKSLKILAVLLMLASPQAFAHGTEYSSYVGVAAGNTFYDEEYDDLSYKGFIGLKANDYVGVEASVNNFGELETTNGLDTVSLTTTGYTATIVFYLPVGPFELFAKGGALFWETETDINNNKISETDGTNATYGGGISIYFSERIWLRGEVEKFEIDDQDDITITSLGFGYDF